MKFWHSIFVASSVFGFTAHSALAQENAQVQLYQQVYDIVEKHCTECHGAESAGHGGIDFILQLDRLVDEGYIIPGLADLSDLFLLVESGEMPDDNPQLSPPDIETIRTWIDQGAFVPAGLGRKPIGFQETYGLVLRDLQEVAANDPLAAKHTRYMLTQNLYNNDYSDRQLDLAIKHITGFINSLSMQEQLHLPRRLGEQGTVLAIDIRKLGWNPDVWERVVRSNPYFVSPFSTILQSMQQLSDSQFPILRADYLIASLAEPESYYKTLELPTTLSDLMATLVVNPSTSEAKGYLKGGFVNSGVSFNNRVIERQEGKYGAFWLSYDFGSSIGRKNIFQFPLGPVEGSSGQPGFLPDGGEMIFSLPNGLQGYFITDANGVRLDEAPTDIVFDPSHPPGTIFSGKSCMTCHQKGIIPKSNADSLRTTVLASNFFDEKTKKEVQLTYSTQEDFNASFRDDSGLFLGALKTIGIENSDIEPLSALAYRMERDVTARIAAAELGLQDGETFLNRVNNVSPGLRQQLSPLVNGGMKRETFETLFRQLVIELDLESAEFTASSRGLSSGGFHTCVISEDSRISCFGLNNFEQINVPVLDQVTSLYMGRFFGCAATLSPSAKSGNKLLHNLNCWGSNAYGQIDIPVIRDLRAFSSGDYHVCAIDGFTVKCWGDNSFGQVDVPADISGPQFVTAGGLHSCAAGANTIQCWGDNQFSQATPPKNLTDISFLASGLHHSCAIARGKIQCWGQEEAFDNQVMGTVTNPMAVCGGKNYSCGFGKERKLVCSGSNENVIGVSPALSGNLLDLSCGEDFACALDEESLKCWGKNDFGQLDVP